MSDSVYPCPVCSMPGGFHDESEESPHKHLRPSRSKRRAAPERICNCGQPIGAPGAGQCRNPRHSATLVPSGVDNQ